MYEIRIRKLLKYDYFIFTIDDDDKITSSIYRSYKVYRFGYSIMKIKYKYHADMYYSARGTSRFSNNHMFPLHYYHDKLYKYIKHWIG